MNWKETNKSYRIEDDRGVFIGSYKKCPLCNYDRARGGNFCCWCGADMSQHDSNLHDRAIADLSKCIDDMYDKLIRGEI